MRSGYAVRMAFNEVWCGAKTLPHYPLFAIDDVDAGRERGERRAVETDAVPLQVVNLRGMAVAGFLQVFDGGNLPHGKGHVKAVAA